MQEAQWSQLSELVAARIGLNFPRERWADLEHGVAEAAQEFGFEDAAACVEWLLSAPLAKAELQVLASHLTIGETYFFRDEQTMEALAGKVLPELIRARRGREERLRIWSAACCTGEEPYSLAILLHQLLPDLPRWHVTITATDINARFLHKAAAGVYGEWSFRNAPWLLKERYFKRTPKGRYAIVPEIKRLVRFEHLNLVEDVYPSLATDTNAMDLILCRNALMYFTPSQMARVIGRLHRALVEGGWLAVSPSEASTSLFSQFATVNFPGAIFYRKRDVKVEAVPAAPLTEPPPAAAAPAEEAVAAETASPPFAAAQSLYLEGRYSESAEVLLARFGEHPAEPAACSLLARAYANQGKLGEALVWCDRWIALDKLDPAGHYLRAIVLLEQGDPAAGRSALRRAIYLDPDFVLAHFALGNLARGGGKIEEADKHFDNALHLLRGRRPDDLLPESDGLTAGRLTETITSLMHAETTP